MKPRLVVICGPTGVGKTELSIRVAEEFGGQIVSADSMQVYRYMDIGTAKPSREERARVPHHMIDVADPDDEFSAGRYARMARKIIADLHGNGILPIMVGGTGLYIKACLHGLFRKRSADPVILKKLEEEAREKGSRAMHEKLAGLDPESAGKIEPGDLFRIVRAIEIFESTGKTATEYRKEHGFSENPFDALQLCLHSDREKLYNDINRRVDTMIAMGLEKEVQRLLEMGYSQDLPSMQSIGYRHFAAFLQGRVPREYAVETMKRDTRRYAKRQLTWFRSVPEIVWVDKKDGLEKVRFLVRMFLRRTGPGKGNAAT